MKSLTQSIQEGLFDIFKSMKQFTKLQGEVVDEYEKLINDNPKRYYSGKSVMDHVRKFAMDKYDEIITVDDAMTFNQWWSEFSKAQTNMLDRTVFNQR